VKRTHPQSGAALERYGSRTLDQDGCLTCEDAGVPVRVLHVDGVVAVCEDRVGRARDVAVEFVPAVRAGDVLLVHGGVALARISEPA